jgi:hypothetical protein
MVDCCDQSVKTLLMTLLEVSLQRVILWGLIFLEEIGYKLHKPV